MKRTLLLLTEPAYLILSPLTIGDCQDLLNDAQKQGMSEEDRAQIAHCLISFAKQARP